MEIPPHPSYIPPTGNFACQTAEFRLSFIHTEIVSVKVAKGLNLCGFWQVVSSIQYQYIPNTSEWLEKLKMLRLTSCRFESDLGHQLIYEIQNFVFWIFSL